MATSEHLKLATFGFQHRKAGPESFGIWNTGTMASALDTGTSGSTPVGYHPHNHLPQTNFQTTTVLQPQDNCHGPTSYSSLFSTANRRALWDLPGPTGWLLT